MKIVEISASLGNGLKRYNVFEQVSIPKQPFTQQESVLYGITKPTDIVQTNEPTNILVDAEGNPIGNSEPVYFGIRVYPFISVNQQIICNNNTITYGEVFGFARDFYFPKTTEFEGRAFLPDPYTGKLYPQPEFVASIPNNYKVKDNHQQAMQQFINDCAFPTKPNLDLPPQSISSRLDTPGGMRYFAYHVSKLTHRPDIATGVLSCIQDTNLDTDYEYVDYMAQFDGQNLNFKFGMADNATRFTQPPKIALPYLYRTYVALLELNDCYMCMGVIMQCLLYDSNGNVISA